MAKCMWMIKLPYKFGVEQEVKPLELEFEDIRLSVIKTNSEYFDTLRVECNAEIDDIKDPHDYQPFELLDLKMQLTRRIGIVANKFCNSFYRQTNETYINQLFNGETFIVPYQMAILNDSGSPIDGSIHSSCNSIRLLNQDTADGIIKDMFREDHDVVEELLRMSKCFLDNGYLDMAVLNLAMALESYIKRFVFSRGIKVQDLNEDKGYVDKFFNAGLLKTIGRSLKEEPEYFATVHLITDIRNGIAHGGRVETLDYFQNKSYEEIYLSIEDLIDEVEDIFEWINS